jgi:hypothetical protein
MKPILTEDQLAKRRKQNKRTLIITGVVLLVIFLLTRLSPNENESSAISVEDSATLKVNSQKQKLKLDSVIAEINKDRDIKANKIEYSPDSTLKIYFTKSSNNVTAAGIETLFNVLSIGNVSEIEVYKNGEIVSTFGFKTQVRVDSFNKNFVSGFDGSCRPVVKYIKEVMNDPDSFDHNKTFVTPLTNGNFEVKTVFRGKNSFGATVLNSCYAEVSSTGSIISFKMED